MKSSDDANYFSLTHFLSKPLFLGIGISKILVEAKESAIFSMLIGNIFGIFILYFLNKVNFYNSTKFKKIIIFFIIYILLIIGLTEFVNLITSIYLMDMNKYIILLPLIILILYMNTKDISVHLKISKILLIITLFLFIFGYIILIPNIDYLNYLPLYNVSFKKILFVGFEFALFTTLPYILYGGIQYKLENKSKKIIKNYISSNFILMIIILIIQGILGIELVNLFKYPEYIIFKKINILNFIQNIENFLSFFWLFTIIMYLSICSKELYDISLSVFNNKYIYPIFLFISLIPINIYLFENVSYLILLYNYLWLICLIILVIYFLVNIKTSKK